MKLKYCGYTYALFDRILQEKQYKGAENIPKARLFAQFHSQQTTRMKEEIISEITKENSTIRVLFATTALGMGVNAPHVNHVIHIGPPSNLESYLQEIGRAGRCGQPAVATLYFNNSDVAAHKTNIDGSMKMYCQSSNVCLRKMLLEYFGFSNVKQKRCCCICDGHYETNDLDGSKSEQSVVKRKVRTLPASQVPKLYKEVEEVLSSFKSDKNSNKYNLMYCQAELVSTSTLMEGIEYILNDADLLSKYGICDELCASKLMSLINTYAPV
jgi:superfamily II DNA helicase RecQ